MTSWRCPCLQTRPFWEGAGPSPAEDLGGFTRRSNGAGPARWDLPRRAVGPVVCQTSPPSTVTVLVHRLPLLLTDVMTVCRSAPLSIAPSPRSFQLTKKCPGNLRTCELSVHAVCELFIVRLFLNTDGSDRLLFIVRHNNSFNILPMVNVELHGTAWI